MNAKIIRGILILLGILALAIAIVEIRRTGRRIAVRATKERLNAIDVALSAYHAEYRAYPTGAAAVILGSLEGSNPKGIVFLPKGRGRDDPWRKPFFLKKGASATSRPEYYSSGPDGIDEGLAPGSDDIEIP